MGFFLMKNFFEIFVKKGKSTLKSLFLKKNIFSY